MYNFVADFKRHDDKKQPYSFYVEKNSHLRHNFGYVENNEYVINCTGGRNFILTPRLQSFILKEEFAIISPMMFRLKWGYYFGYDFVKRSGKLLTVAYNQDNKELEIKLLDVAVNVKRQIERVVYENIVLEEDKYFPITLDVSAEYCKVNVNGVEAVFNHSFTPGQVGITKEDGGAGFKLKSLSLTSPDELKTKKIYEGSFKLTKNEDSLTPYTVDLEILEYENGVKELTTKLHGGVEFTVPHDPKCKSWWSSKDRFESPYFRFIGDCEDKKFYLRSGRITFVDDINAGSRAIGAANLADPTAKKERPFTSVYSSDDFDGFEYFVFGYDFHRSYSGFFESAYNKEQVYDKNGNLLYYGDRLESPCIIQVASVKSEIEALIAKSDFLAKEDAFAHIRKNHYFTNNETPSFDITVLTDKKGELTPVRAYLANAFFKKICDLDPVLISECQNAFSKNERRFSLETDKLSQGVYHIVIECYFGDTVLNKHESAFEVFDMESEKSPLESSELPFLFSGDADTPRPTTWSHYPDNNLVHYVGSTVGGPRQYDAKKIWEINKIYRRKSLVWWTQRTAARETYVDHIDCVKNADYIYYLYPGIEESANYYRCDHFHKSLFQAKQMRIFFNEFVSLHPEYKLNALPVEVEGTFNMSYDEFKKLEPIFDEWVDFVNPKVDKLFDEQWAEILKVNPNVKRYSYGPYPTYGTRATGGEAMKYFGHPESVIGKRFAFVQFEDYAFCCNYPLAYSVWGATTSKLIAPTLEIGPELYDSFEPGCPDGHVSFPTPPFSESYAPPYQTVSQMYGYLYHSLRHDKDGFKYWDNDKFMMYSAYNLEPQKRFREVMEAWGKYLENKPKNPKKTVAYLFKLSNKDNEFELESAVSGRSVTQNSCGVGMSYIYTKLSELGIPAGFPTNNILALTENDIDMLVLPSTYALTSAEIDKVRELYNKGVKLIATGDVTGLEDLFGVQRDERESELSVLYRGKKRENIHPFKTKFTYGANGAEVILSEGDSNPVLLKTDKTLLINASLGIVGAENFEFMHAIGGRENVSTLIKEAVCETLLSFVSPVARAYGEAYLDIFESENGHDEIMLYQCTDYEQNPHLITVEINSTDYKDVLLVDGERTLNKIYDNGRLWGFELLLKPRETALLRLVK